MAEGKQDYEKDYTDPGLRERLKQWTDEASGAKQARKVAAKD